MTIWQFLLAVLFAIGFLAPAPTVAFTSQLMFENRMQGSNLPFGEIRAVVHGSDGFLWVGGDAGMYRYDGYTFTPIPIKGAPQSPLGEQLYISSIFEDSAKRLWVGSTAGLMMLDRDLNLLRPITLELTEKPYINGFAELSDGDILIAAYQGLFHFDHQTEAISVIAAERSKRSLNDNTFFDILVSDDQNVWLGMRTGLVHFNAKTQVFTPKPLPALSQGGHDLTVRAIEPAGKGNLWLGTFEGLAHYNPTSLAINVYRHDPNDPKSLSSHKIWDLLQDKHGDLWVATDGGGLNQLPANQVTFIHHKHSIHQTGALSSNVARCVVEDRSGNLWVGNYPDGLNYLDRSMTGFSHIGYNGQAGGLSQNSVVSVAETPDGNLWLGTDGGGINYLEARSQNIRYYQRNPFDDQSLASNAVHDLLLEGSQLWAATWGGGLNRLDTTTGKVTRYPFTRRQVLGAGQGQVLNTENVWTIAPDNQGRFWLGTHNGGLAIVDPARSPGEAEFLHHTYHPERPNGVPTDIIWDIIHTPDNRHFLATLKGVCEFNEALRTCTQLPGTELLTNTLSNRSVTAIYLQNPWLWLGTENGLHRYHLSEHSLTTITEADGLADANIRSMITDSQGRLWLGTKRGISMLDSKGGKIENYKRYQGHDIGAMNARAVSQSKTGQLLFGGIDGLFMVDPNTIEQSSSPPKVALTGLQVFAEPIRPDPASALLTKAIYRTERITLNHTQRMFTFSFAALTFRNAPLNTYAYKLEGFDEQWRHVGHLRHATYTNLGPGHYRFVVKAANDEGIWSRTPASLDVLIKPAPWRSWWANGLYAIGLCALLALSYAFGSFKRQTTRFGELSVTDPMTRVLNRVGIREVALTYFSSAAIKQHTGIMLLDIDHFKRINDKYGHDTGDAVLVQFTEVIKHCIRKGDHLGRWGGEEFILICPSIDSHNLKRLAEKLVYAISMHKMRSQSHTLQITTSIGYTMVRTDEHFDACVAAADKALYLAKAKRNMAVGAGYR